MSSDTIMTVDTYDRRLDTYCTREGNSLTYAIKRKNETAELGQTDKKITCEEYT